MNQISGWGESAGCRGGERERAEVNTSSQGRYRERKQAGNSGEKKGFEIHFDCSLRQINFFRREKLLMAYRRRQEVSRVSVVKQEIGSSFSSEPLLPPPPYDEDDVSSSPPASSLAAKAIRASSAHRDSSLSSAYGQSALSSPRDSVTTGPSSPSPSKGSSSYEYTSMKNLNEPKQGFWGTLARKAKSILDEDNVSPQNDTSGKTRLPVSGGAARAQYDRTYQSSEGRPKTDSPKLQRGLGAIATSLNYIGGTIGNALEEGLTVVENRTADIIQETRKLQMRRKGSNTVYQNQTDFSSPRQQQSTLRTHGQSQVQADLEIQLKASRDVAMAMAAKAKLLLRELKTVKADFAFAKERCAQLEEENRILRESREKGDNQEDDDLIRLQLETLLAEKARLAQENSVFARENRFLREIVEYHQLTMQDVVYFDEGSEEVTEVYPIKVPSTSNLQSLVTPTSLSGSSPSPKSPYIIHPEVNDGNLFHPLTSEPKDSRLVTSYIHVVEEDKGKQ